MAEDTEQAGTEDRQSRSIRLMYSSLLGCWMQQGYSELQAVFLLYELVACDLERLAPPDDLSRSSCLPFSISLH
jgi:hypothetical protein